MKHDGYRLIARRVGKRVRLFTKNGYDWTNRYPLIVEAVGRLKVKSVVLDGEGVCFGRNGLPEFDLLHCRLHDSVAQLLAFDLLELDGEDLRDRPLEERKARLEKLLSKNAEGIGFVEHLEGDSTIVFKEVCKRGLEGIVCKSRTSRYRPGLSRSWLKVKNGQHPALLRVAQAHEWERGRGTG